MCIGNFALLRNLIVGISALFLCSCSNVDEYQFVEDRGGLLTNEQLELLQAYHQALLQDLDVHFKLIVLEEKAGDINELAVELFGKLGEKTSAAKGLLFLVDPTGQQVRIEVGYDLEQVFPDGFVGYIEEKQMIPFFEVGQVSQGVEATGELLVSRMLWFLEGKDFNKEIELGDLQHFSGGSGAKTDVAVNFQKLEKGVFEKGDDFLGQTSLIATLEAY